MASSGAASTPGQRIARLLEQSNLSAAQVADEMMLSPNVPFERVLDGSYEASVSELLGAAEVLGVPIAVLTGELPVEGHLGVSLRLGRVAGADALSAPLSYANRVLDHGALLRTWLGPPEAPLARLLAQVPLSQDGFGRKAGQVTAERVRAVLGLGDDEPIGDMVALVEDLGIPVVTVPLPPDVHGLNVRDLRSGGADRVVLVASGDLWAKQRYTLAHELCHALYDDPDQVIVDRAEEPAALPEWRAEAFARHLLLPARAVRAAVGDAPRGAARWEVVTARLMVRFGISREATVIALETDGQVPAAELLGVREGYIDTFMRAAGLVEDWRRLTGAPNDESGSPMLVARAAQAYANGWIRGEVVADLMLDADVDQTVAELASAGWAPPVLT